MKFEQRNNNSELRDFRLRSRATSSIAQFVLQKLLRSQLDAWTQPFWRRTFPALIQMMLNSPGKSTGKRQALPTTVEMAKVNNHVKLRGRLSRAKIKAKNAALGSMDKVGGVEMSDLDLAGWGVPFVFLYYSVISIITIHVDKEVNIAIH